MSLILPLKSYMNTCTKLVDLDCKSKVRCFCTLFELPDHITIPKMLLCMSKYHMYRILVGVFSNNFPPSLLTNYCPSLIAHIT